MAAFQTTPGAGPNERTPAAAIQSSVHAKVPSAILRTAYRSSTTWKDLRNLSPESRELFEDLDEMTTGRNTLSEITAGRHSPNDAPRFVNVASAGFSVMSSAAPASGAGVKRALNYGSAPRGPNLDASFASGGAQDSGGRRSRGSWSERSLSPLQSPDIWDSATSIGSATEQRGSRPARNSRCSDSSGESDGRLPASAAAAGSAPPPPAGRRLFPGSAPYSAASGSNSPPLRLPTVSPPPPVDFSMSSVPPTSASSAGSAVVSANGSMFFDTTPARSPPEQLHVSPVRAVRRRAPSPAVSSGGATRSLPSSHGSGSGRSRRTSEAHNSMNLGGGNELVRETKFEDALREAKTPSPSTPAMTTPSPATLASAAGFAPASAAAYGANIPAAVAAPGAATSVADGEMHTESEAPADAPKTEQEMLEESERLCRQLMEEEQAALCQRIEEEQRRVIAAMRGTPRGTGTPRGATNTPGEADDVDPDADLAFAMRLAAEGEDEEYEDEGEDIDPDAMTYDELLELGEHIGDVAQERWRVEGREAVASLSVVTFNQSMLRTPGGGSQPIIGDTMCLVCQYDFEDGEKLKVLPCGHAFHPECIDGWLADHKTCVTCKRPIDGSSPAH